MGIELRFKRLTKDVPISEKSKKWHPIIADTNNPQKIILVGLKNGQQALFSAGPNVKNFLDGQGRYRSSNNWLFLKVPSGVTMYSLRGTTRDSSGWKY